MAFRSIRILVATWAVLFSTWVSLSSVCFGDTVTVATASLEWKVDSADDIFLTSVVEDQSSPWGGRFTVLQQLKGNHQLESIDESLVQRCRLKHLVSAQYKSQRQSPIGTSWILFLRGEGDLSRISGTINLSHPLQHWDTAAITAFNRKDARVLKSAEAILSQIKRRVEENHVLPTDCDPELTEQQLIRHLRKNQPPPVFIGAKLLYVAIDVWDSTGVLVNPILVPNDVPPTAADYEVSYDPEYNPRQFVTRSLYSRIRMASPPENTSGLVGTWKGDLGDRVLTVNLQPRGTMLFLSEAKRRTTLPLLPEPSGSGFGAGVWSVLDDSLSLKGTHYINGRWRRERAWESKAFDLMREQIQQQDNDTFVLTDGTTFRRQPAELCAFQYPHLHPWHMISRGWGKYRTRVKIRVLVNGSDPSQSARPLKDVVMWRMDRGNSAVPGPSRPKQPKTVQVKLGDNGFEPRIAVLRAGDTIEIEAVGERPVIDHNINLAWFLNGTRWFAPRLEPPLIYQEVVARGEPALMHIECNIHDDEHGYLVVTDHGDVSVTDEDGYAMLRDWPIGEQKIRIEHPDYNLGNAEVWLDGVKVKKDRLAIWLDIDAENLELRLTGVQAKQ